MRNNVEQKISKVDDADIFQIAGGVTYNTTYNVTASPIDAKTLEKISDICQYVVRREMETYAQQAFSVAQSRVQGYIDCFSNRLEHVEEKVRQKLQQPQVQMSLRNSMLCGLKLEDENLIDENIGIMIDRLEAEEHSTHKFITDQAIQMLQQLSRKQLSLLALYCFFELRLSLTARGVEDALSHQLTAILNDVGEITTMDFTYLDSIGCYSNTQMFMSRDNFLKAMLGSYDILFSQHIDQETFFSTLTNNNTSKEKASSIWYNLFDKNNPNRLPWSVVLNDPELEIGDRGRLAPIIIPMIHSISIDELEKRLIGYNEVWKKALKVLNSRISRGVYLGPVARYLGVRYLKRYIHTNVDYQIFYKPLN